MAPTVVSWRAAIGRMASASARLCCSCGGWNSGERERQSSAAAPRPALGERAGQQAGLHRAVDDDAGVVRRAPGQLGGERRRGESARTAAAACRRGPSALGDLEPIDLVVRQARRRGLCLPSSGRAASASTPRSACRPRPASASGRDRSVRRRGVSATARPRAGATPAGRCARDCSMRIAVVPHQAALGEDKRPIACG